MKTFDSSLESPDQDESGDNNFIKIIKFLQLLNLKDTFQKWRADGRQSSRYLDGCTVILARTSWRSVGCIVVLARTYWRQLSRNHRETIVFYERRNSFVEGQIFVEQSVRRDGQNFVGQRE